MSTTETRKTRSGKVRDVAEKPAKKEKDPDMPKRPLTSYFLYTQDKRDEMKKKNPEMKLTQITKELAKEWKTLSDTDKEPYEKKATEAKTKYQTEMAEYKKKHGIEDKKKKPAASKKRKAKDEEEEEEEEDADE